MGYESACFLLPDDGPERSAQPWIQGLARLSGSGGKKRLKLCGRLPFDAAVRKDESGLFIQKEIGRVAVAQQMAALGISDGFALSAVALGTDVEVLFAEDENRTGKGFPLF